MNKKQVVYALFGFVLNVFILSKEEKIRWC